jgi:hypothetical protein
VTPWLTSKSIEHLSWTADLGIEPEAKRHTQPNPEENTRAAGAILVAGTVLTVLCNGYFSVRYHVPGEFDHAYPHPAAMAGRMLGVPMPTASAADGTSLSATPPGHEEHHPDGSHED